MIIRQLRPVDSDDWLSMRMALWPDTSPKRHRKDMEMVMSKSNRYAVFVCEDSPSDLVGFAEVSLREWAEGCLSSPVGYLVTVHGV